MVNKVLSDIHTYKYAETNSLLYFFEQVGKSKIKEQVLINKTDDKKNTKNS